MKKNLNSKKIVAVLLSTAFVLSGCGGTSTTAGNSSQAQSGGSISTTSNDNKVSQPVLKEDDPSLLVPIDGNDGIDASGIKTTQYEVAFVAGDAAYEYSNLSEDLADRYAAAVKKAKSILGDKTTIYDIVIPTAMDVTLPDSIRSTVTGTKKQKDSISYVYSAIGDAAKCVDIIDVLRQHKKEYLYFKTDHHWTALAGYYTYREFCKLKGISANSLYDYKTVEFDGFTGSYIDHIDDPVLNTSTDKVIAYYPLSTNDMKFTDTSGSTLDWSVIQDVSDWNSSSKYNTFIGGDNPFSVITNPKINDGSSILVVKESFGNAVTPFFVDHYQNVYVVDYRYYNGTLSALASEYNITDMVFLTAISAGMGNIASLEEFIQ